MTKRTKILMAALTAPLCAAAWVFLFYTPLNVGETVPVRLWPEATEVRLFVEDMPYDQAEASGKTMTNPAGTRLTKAQRAILDTALRRHRMTEEESNWVAACFVPHHFFRYYDAGGNKLGELALCYCCKGVSPSSYFPALRYDEIWEFDYDRIKAMMAAMGISSQAQCNGAGA